MEVVLRDTPHSADVYLCLPHRIVQLVVRSHVFVIAQFLLRLLMEKMENHAEGDKIEKSEPGLEVLWSPPWGPLPMQWAGEGSHGCFLQVFLLHRPRARQQECFQEGEPLLKQKLETSHLHTPGRDLCSSIYSQGCQVLENNLLMTLVQEHWGQSSAIILLFYIIRNLSLLKSLLQNVPILHGWASGMEHNPGHFHVWSIVCDKVNGPEEFWLERGLFFNHSVL